MTDIKAHSSRPLAKDKAEGKPHLTLKLVCLAAHPMSKTAVYT